jgi:serine/threonine-protein kinase
VREPDPVGGDSPPQLLGRYAVYEKIASGGMASVHIGRLIGPVGFARTVAVKRMHAQFAEDPEFVSMFLDEARLAARIRHPNVVQTLDVVASDGELFLVMDFVQGESLARLIRAASARSEKIPPTIVATIMTGVLHGLHAAHEAKNEQGMPLSIVHRDVSPHNVLVGVDGVSRVLDFGVAKAADRAQSTRDGQLKGKLAYMSCEQVRGEATRATDIYAASVVLWEALTGKRLFTGENAAQLVAQILEGCHTVPSRYVPDLAPALDALTMRGLDVDPAKRFATAREMARALEDALPLASASKVGDWVETRAHDTLTKRGARIAAIESDSFAQVAPESGRVGLPPGRTSHPSFASSKVQVQDAPDPTSIAVTDDMIVTQLSSGSVSSPRAGERRGGRGLWIAMGSLVGVGLATVAAVLLLRDPEPALHAAGSRPLAAVPSAPSASATPVPMAASVPLLEETPGDSRDLPDASAAKEPAPTPASKPAVATASSPPVQPPPPPQPRATPGSLCNPPYYFDARGVRIFKTECL